MTAPPHPSPAERAVCSAKGCREAAHWSLRWNNPKLHAPERRKTWVACAEHRAHLSEFLQVRGFLREVEPLESQSPGGAAADVSDTPLP